MFLSSSPLRLPVPSPFGQSALVRKGGLGGLAPWAGGLGEPSLPPGQQGGLAGGTPPMLGAVVSIFSVWKACQTCFSMERKERTKIEYKRYEVLNKMSCVDGLEDLRTDKPQSIETRLSLNIKKPKLRAAEGENICALCENLVLAVTQAQEARIGA